MYDNHSQFSIWTVFTMERATDDGEIREKNADILGHITIKEVSSISLFMQTLYHHKVCMSLKVWCFEKH